METLRISMDGVNFIFKTKFLVSIFHIQIQVQGMLNWKVVNLKSNRFLYIEDWKNMFNIQTVCAVRK